MKGNWKGVSWDYARELPVENIDLYSNEQRLIYDSTPLKEEYTRKLNSIIHILTKRQQKIIDMYFNLGMKQIDIAKKLRCNQSCISLEIKQIKNKIKKIINIRCETCGGEINIRKQPTCKLNKWCSVECYSRTASKGNIKKYINRHKL